MPLHISNGTRTRRACQFEMPTGGGAAGDGGLPMNGGIFVEGDCLFSVLKQCRDVCEVECFSKVDGGSRRLKEDPKSKRRSAGDFTFLLVES